LLSSKRAVRLASVVLRAAAHLQQSRDDVPHPLGWGDSECYCHRLEESETLRQQAQNNSLAQFSASPDLQSEFVGAVIGAMESHNDLSTQILNNSEISQKLMGN
jgi:hypothetical protein